MIKQEFKSQHSNYIIGKQTEYQLKNIAKPVVFSVECIFLNKHLKGERCDDFVLFDKLFDKNRNGTGAYLIEKKSRSSDVPKVIDQLRGGAKFIENFINSDRAMHMYKSAFDFRPIMVSHELPDSALKKLRIESISICGKKRLVDHVITGKNLPRF